jgi:hypothetical protein
VGPEALFIWFANLRLRWKVLFAPAFLITVLIGTGLYALQEQRANQASITALMAGPVHQAESVADFTNSAWTSQVHLYRLMATAANETDPGCVKTLPKVVSAQQKNRTCRLGESFMRKRHSA